MTTHTGEVMGTVATVRFIEAPDAATDPGRPTRMAAAAEAFLAAMRDDEAIFSPFQAGSAIRRIARGELTIADAPPQVVEVERACRNALAVTDGRFDAWRDGWFDPTGLVKGWSIDRAFEARLAPLLTIEPGIAAVGVTVGGDLRVATAPTAEWSWSIAVSNPFDPSRGVARVSLRDGAIASSGSAERGAHIIDPALGRPAESVTQATVIADPGPTSLQTADLWATVAVIAGPDNLTWAPAAPGIQTVLLVAPDTSTRRWDREPDTPSVP
ncbi:MAG: FAD:protein FMN transferase [Promicromonosporaceae bacterium]|nr:FAD:protein FMN transferase [Promicromonosporaceae bacterium]